MKLTAHFLVPRLKNAWSYTSTPQCASVAWCLFDNRGNFSIRLCHMTMKSFLSFSATVMNRLKVRGLHFVRVIS
jgi:hypothetical protein